MSNYTDVELQFVKYYKDKSDEIHYDKPLRSYGWHKYLIDIDFVSGCDFLKPQPRIEDKHYPHIPVDMDYTFDELWEILLEYERFPEMLDIYLHREQTSTGLTHKGHVSMEIISAFREYLRVKYGCGWKVDKATSIAIGFACEANRYLKGIRDEAFMKDVKAGVYGKLNLKRG